MSEKGNAMKYIGYYDCEENRTENRNYVLAATNKMTYIAKTLAENGIPWEIILVSDMWYRTTFHIDVDSLYVFMRAWENIWNDYV